MLVGGVGPAGRPPGLGRGLLVEVDPGRSFSGESRSRGDTVSSSGRPGDGSWSSMPCSVWRPSPRRAGPRRSPITWPGRFETRRLWWLLAAWVVPGWLLSDVTAQSTTLEAEFLAVGHGLAVLLHTPDGQTLLYDCGRLGDPTVGRRIIAPALWARGVTRIDTVFLSHADQDHYDGLPDLLDRFPIGEVRLPPGFAGVDNPMAIQLIEQLQARGIPVQPITAPESWEKAGVRFTVWHPPAGWHPETSDNARSLVLDVAFAGRHLLLTGDLEQLGLDELVAHPPPQPPPDVFLAPHHGGKSANPEWLYQWAKPRLVVVSQRPLARQDQRRLSLRSNAVGFPCSEPGARARSACDGPTTASLRGSWIDSSATRRLASARRRA